MNKLTDESLIQLAKSLSNNMLNFTQFVTLYDLTSMKLIADNNIEGSINFVVTDKYFYTTGRHKEILEALFAPKFQDLFNDKQISCINSLTVVGLTRVTIDDLAEIIQDFHDIFILNKYILIKAVSFSLDILFSDMLLKLLPAVKLCFKYSKPLPNTYEAKAPECSKISQYVQPIKFV